MENGAALVATDLAKSYGAIRALDGVDLRVEPGELVVLLGPNGAGKSTLIQLLTGLFAPDRGSISVYGQDMARAPTRALARLGVVFQQPSVDLELTAEGNLLFHGALHGLPRRLARRRAHAALERFGLGDRAGEPLRALSGGNRRRVELARALLHEPSLLLMDEPTVGLDPASRQDMLAHIGRLKAERGLGILWTTHLVDEAERADRLVVLHRGTVRYDGTTAGLLRREGAATIGAALLSATGARAGDDRAAGQDSNAD